MIGVPHEKWGEAVHAVVVLHDGQSASAANCSTGAATHGRLQAAAVGRLHRRREMPRTATGKILHRVLRDRLAGIDRTIRVMARVTTFVASAPERFPLGGVAAQAHRSVGESIRKSTTSLPCATVTASPLTRLSTRSMSLSKASPGCSASCSV